MPVRDDLADGLRAASIPEVAGVLTAGQVLATGHSVAAMQQPSGAIGWPDGHVDAWNHVECAMALTVCGLTKPARRAYRWLAAAQRPDGSWPREITGERITNADAESNQAAYAAVGVWHELQVTGDEEFARTMWPVVRRAIAFTLGLRTTRGEIRWKRAQDGTLADFALLAGSASIHQSLRCAMALAEFMGEPQPEWELAADQLAHVLAAHPEAFADKSRFSMDWYYPVLGGAVRGRAAADRLAEGWDVFVEPGLGVRCVSDQPWVTGAETCELVLALEALSDRDTALRLFGDVQHLRCEDGSYWTGWQFANQAHFPDERSSWTAAAIVLAADALCGATGGATLFHDAGAATVTPVDPAACGCAV
jgi:hypothetical protein